MNAYTGADVMDLYDAEQSAIQTSMLSTMSWAEQFIQQIHMMEPHDAYSLRKSYCHSRTFLLPTSAAL
jgi:hypothetical protein